MNSTHPHPRICVVGACNIDLISYVPRMPAVGETLHGTRFQMGFGGKGANQAVMAAKLGAGVTMITKLGRDVFGENTLKNFERLGIDTRHVHFTDQAFSVGPLAVYAEVLSRETGVALAPITQVSVSDRLDETSSKLDQRAVTRFTLEGTAP